MKQSRKAFTIVELLTVMSIIVILFSLLVPSMTMVRRYAKKVNQNAQFHAINAALQLFHNEWGYYPDSDQLDSDDQPYCGAMKLAEAMVGQDKLGFHPDSRFRADGTNGATTPKQLYFPADVTNAAGKGNLRARSGPYLPLEGANATYINTIWPPTDTTAAFPTWSTNDPNAEAPLVLCDEYTRRIGTDKISMPILYFKADPSKLTNDTNTWDSGTTIYNLEDNIDIINLGIPYDTTTHEIAEAGTTPSGSAPSPLHFYEQIKDREVISSNRPKNVDTYILMSAGYDGVYGTKDDVFNFKN